MTANDVESIKTLPDTERLGPMDFSEALRAMKEGCSVYRIKWPPKICWAFIDEDEIVLSIPEYSLSSEDLLATDWWIKT
jgi:hypothetical protein